MFLLRLFERNYSKRVAPCLYLCFSPLCFMCETLYIVNACVCVCLGAACWADGSGKATESLILSDGFMRLHLLNPATISVSAKNLHSRQDYRHRLHLIFHTLPPHPMPTCVCVCVVSPSRISFLSSIRHKLDM